MLHALCCVTDWLCDWVYQILVIKLVIWEWNWSKVFSFQNLKIPNRFLRLCKAIQRIVLIGNLVNLRFKFLINKNGMEFFFWMIFFEIEQNSDGIRWCSWRENQINRTNEWSSRRLLNKMNTESVLVDWKSRKPAASRQASPAKLADCCSFSPSPSLSLCERLSPYSTKAERIRS